MIFRPITAVSLETLSTDCCSLAERAARAWRFNTEECAVCHRGPGKPKNCCRWSSNVLLSVSLTESHTHPLTLGLAAGGTLMLQHAHVLYVLSSLHRTKNHFTHSSPCRCWRTASHSCCHVRRVFICIWQQQGGVRLPLLCLREPMYSVNMWLPTRFTCHPEMISFL